MRPRFYVVGAAAALIVGCGGGDHPNSVGDPSAKNEPPNANQVPLDPTTIPQFVNQLRIQPVFKPTVIKDASGNVIRNEYTVTDSQTQAQVLPPGFPTTTIMAMGGTVQDGTTFQGAPAATFENIRNIPTVVHWRTNVQQPHFLPVDPVLRWANPLSIERPVPPFNLFPPGYTEAQFPVAHVTHTHGLVVRTDMDGTLDEWFTPGLNYRGPSFATNDYTMPNGQPSTQLFFHDHVVGATRLGLYEGEVGAAYIIRDPNSPLDQASSPLPKGQFEIVLGVTPRQFYTDGELAFPPDRGTLNAGQDAPDNIPYWTYDEGSDTNVVNGRVWPNLNVQPRQYRFRVLMGGNTELYDYQLLNAATGAVVPVTLIGSDGGYLPAPAVVNDFMLGITERADVLVDFSQFPAGTKLIWTDAFSGPFANPASTLFKIMQFTVQSGTPVHPPALNASLFPKRAVLTPDAPRRVKVLRAFSDLRNADGTCGGKPPNCNQRSLDGLQFTMPPTEYPLVGSTEEWDLVNITSGDPDDPDHQFHQIHIHLLEFQVVNKTPFDDVAYMQQWHLLNGNMPTTRPIVLDPTPFFTGPPITEPYESGWKDTVHTPPGFVTKVLVRWAPQEQVGGSPGVNNYPIDPTAFPQNVDTFTGPGYVWHCHIVGHEDHDMIRPLAVVNNWAAGKTYNVGNVVAFNNVDYRARSTFTSASGQTPPTRFDLWERVNNNDGSWQPQIIYGLNERVLSNGRLFSATKTFQAQPNQTPATTPTLWKPLPMTACGQLAQFCAGNPDPTATQCAADGRAGNNSVCTPEIENCLAVCVPQQTTPCTGLCDNPVRFSVADGSNFQSGPLGTGAGCFETFSRLALGEDSSFVAPRQITVNGRPQLLNQNWRYPLPPQRNEGYCIQTSPGNNSFAAFAVW